MLHPKEIIRDWNSGKNREGSLCPGSVNSQEPFLVSLATRKALRVQNPQVQRRGHSVQQKGHHTVIYLQSVLTWNIHTVILCESESLSSIWIASKTKGKPSLVITILSTCKGPQLTTLEHVWSLGMCFSSDGLDTVHIHKKGKTETQENDKYQDSIQDKLPKPGKKQELLNMFFLSKFSNLNEK